MTVTAVIKFIHAKRAGKFSVLRDVGFGMIFCSEKVFSKDFLVENKTD